MEQQQFQIYDDVQGFKPMEVSSYIPTLDRNQKIQADAEQEYLAQLRQNNRVRQKNAELAGKDLIALGELSKKLSDVLVERQKGINEEDEAEAYNQAYLNTINGNGPDTAELDQGLEQAKSQATVAADVGAAVLGDNGENYEAAQRFTKPTTWKAVGALKGRLAALADQYPVALEEYVTTNNPQSSEERALLVNNFRRNYFKGLSGVSSKYLSKDFYPRVGQAEAKLATRWRKQFAVEDSETVRTEATASFNNDFDIPTYINSIRNTVDGQGKPLGYSGAWQEFTQTVTEARKAGLISETQLQNMRDQVIPEGAPGAGKKYGEFYKSRFGQIERNIRSQRNSDYQLGETEKAREIKEFETNLVSSLIDTEADPDGFTDDQLEQAQETYMRMSGGQRSRKLDNIARLTVDSKTREDQDKQIQKMINLGILTPEELAKFDPKLQQKYMSTAQQQGKALRDNNNFKTQTAAIKDAVEYVADVSPLTKKHPSVGLKVAELQEDFRKKYQVKVLGGMDAKTAAQSAMSEVITEFQAKPDLDKKGAFPGVMGTASPQAQAAAEDQALAIAETLQEQGSAGLDKTDTFFDEATLENMSKDFGKPGFTYDPRLLYIADKLGMSPLDVLRKQRKAYGMVEIPPTPAEEIIQNELTPEQRTLLNTTPSVERSQRGMTGVKTFNASLLPSKAQPYAQQIDIAASAYDIPPAILAGLLETESSWNPTNRSPRGAQGLAQFMPATAAEMGVTNPNDPMQAIDGAAKYLRHLMDNYGFDLNTAIKAYNAGPGGIDKSQENREYLPKVLKSAGKYGYGAQALQEPSLVRPSSPVLAYISGNIGPTSTGAHLDVKQVGGGRFEETALDEFVEVDDPEFGRVSLGEIRKRTGGLGDNFDQHAARGSHGIDYGLHSGTKVFVKNGAKVVNTRPSEHGDVTTIQLPNGKQYTFIHGTKA